MAIDKIIDTDVINAEDEIVITIEVAYCNPYMTFVIDFDDADQEALQEKFGHIPLPPYIKRGDEGSDFERYQTIFAKVSGAVAAPTAGLHFTPDVIAELDCKGIVRS